tara:strand:+ start:120 stop:464 length:345 start_codon:yes stop_codon:yes gene_type:complete
MVDNLIIYIFIFFFWIVVSFYSTKAENSYPVRIHQYVREPIYKIVVGILIVLLAQFNLALAVLVMMVYLLMVSDINLLSDVNESFVFGPPVAACSTYDSNDIEKTGTPFYPINP